MTTQPEFRAVLLKSAAVPTDHRAIATNGDHEENGQYL